MSTRDNRSLAAVAALSLGVCVSNGFGRFAYGLILPAMREDHSWSYTEAGWINTANALGYLCGAILTFALIHRAGTLRLFSAGMLGTSIALLASGFGEGLVYLTIWRVLAGICGAMTFIAGSAIAAGVLRDDPKRNALAIALYFGGGGVGMALAGAALPALFSELGHEAWPLAWVLLGAASLAFCWPALWAAASLEKAASTHSVARGDTTGLPIWRMSWALVGYLLFATGYIVHLTYIVALMQMLSNGPLLVAMVWVALGGAVIVSPFLWRRVLATSSGGGALALATLMTAVGTLLPILSPTAIGLMCSGIVVGLSIFIAPTAITSFSRKNLPAIHWGRSIGLFTIIFGIGQAAGPVAAGWIGDVSGDIRYAFGFAGTILLLGAVFSAAQTPLLKAGSVGRAKGSGGRT